MKSSQQGSMSNSHRNSRSETPIIKQSFFDSFEDSSFFEWLSKNGKNAVYLLVGLIALLIIVYRLSSTHTIQAEKDYMQAAADFALFQKPAANGSTAANEALQSLNSIMAAHSELHAAYDGAIAQTLLNRGQPAEAKPFAQRVLNRTKSDELPYYSDFASTTLLIAEQQYAQALEKAIKLQSMMSEQIDRTAAEPERSFGDILFAFNLLRVAMLHQQLGNKDLELQAWQKWKQYAGLDKAAKENLKVNPQAFRSLIQQLAIGSISLPDYISHREKLLNQ